MTCGLGLRAWGLRLISTTHPPPTRKISFSSFPFLPQRSLTTSCSVSEPMRGEKKQKVIVISGPTGSGKTRLALELAKRLNGEIISADSVQVYRGLDIGSAKPSPSDRKEVPHHLVDILDPFEDYSVGQFFEDARQATRDILEKGHVPIVAGGTGLYLRWYMYGKPEVPKATLEVASEAFSELMVLQKNGDWDAAVQLLEQSGDPKAHLVARNNWYRLRRGLEIIKLTGSPPSAFHVPYDSFKEHLDQQISDTPYEATSTADCLGEDLSKDLDYDFICFFLSSQRVDLYRQIDLRCEEMLAGGKGILSEAMWLLDLGLLPNMNSATRAIGYRQAMEFLVKCREQGGSSVGDFYTFLSEFQKASRNFAKRQMTWFRNELIYQWIDASKPLDIVLNFILDAYHDESGKMVVPESLRMDKDVTGGREAFELKTYRTNYRHFVTREDCCYVLDWIRGMQSRLKSACSQGEVINH